MRMRLVLILLLACLTASGRAMALPCPPRPTPTTFAIWPDANGAVITRSEFPDGTYLQFTGCLQPGTLTFPPIPPGAPDVLPTPMGPAPYYTGSITNLFFDQKGHFIGSSGQPLIEANHALSSSEPHAFGAGIDLGYSLRRTEPAGAVLIRTAIVPCRTIDLGSCNGTPVTFLWGKNTKPASGTIPVAPRSCGNPSRRLPSVQLPPQSATPSIDELSERAAANDEDAEDKYFRLFTEGEMRVVDDPTAGRTVVSLNACIRFVSMNPAEPSGRVYDAQGTVVFFNTAGQVLDSAQVGVQGFGGQQLYAFTAKDAPILGDPLPVLGMSHGQTTLKDGISNFSTGVTLPLTPHATIATDVLVAVSVKTRCGGVAGCTDSEHAYFRVLKACAPDIDPTKVKCWGG